MSGMDTRQPRVLHVAAGNLFGGIERMLLAIASAQQPDCRHDIAVGFDGRLAAELRAAGLDAHVLGDVRFRRPDTVWRARRVLLRLLDAGRYDALIAHAPWSGALASPVARRAARPWLQWMHDPPRPDEWPERRVTRHRPDLFVCNSRYTSDAVARWQPDVPRAVVYPPVVPGAPLTSDERRRLRAGLGAGDGTVVIVLASRFERWKGHALLLQAAARLRGDFTIWIAGGVQRPVETDYLDELAERAADPALAQRVRFLGDRHDVPRLMAAADVHCQPNTGPEPFGIAFVEALYAGLPVVTTAMAGALEIVDGTCGLLVREPSDILVAEALQSLIDRPALRASLSAAAPAQARRISDPIARLADVRDLIQAQLTCSSIA